MADELIVTIRAPEAIDQGGSLNFDIDYEMPDGDVGGQYDVSVLIEIDDQYLDQRGDQVAPGDVGITSLEHVFITPGTREIRTEVAAETSDGAEVFGIATHQLTVDGEPFGDTLLDEEDRAAVSETLIEEGGWGLDDQSTERIFDEQRGAVEVTADSHTAIYTKEDLQTRIREGSFGAIDQALAFFFNAWIEFDPGISTLPPAPREFIADVDADARDQFLSRMEANGLEEITEVDRYTMDVVGGWIADITEYEAVFDVDDSTFAVPGGEEVTVPGDQLPIEAIYGIWSDTEHVYVGGGATPGSNFATTVTDAITEGIDVEIEIDLELAPDTYREEIEGLLRSTQ